MQQDKNLQKVIELDKLLRKLITEYFSALQKMNMPDDSVKLLTEHLSMLVDMIKSFKKDGN